MSRRWWLAALLLVGCREIGGVGPGEQSGHKLAPMTGAPLTFVAVSDASGDASAYLAPGDSVTVDSARTRLVEGPGQGLGFYVPLHPPGKATVQVYSKAPWVYTGELTVLAMPYVGGSSQAATDSLRQLLARALPDLATLRGSGSSADAEAASAADSITAGLRQLSKELDQLSPADRQAVAGFYSSQRAFFTEAFGLLSEGARVAAARSSRTRLHVAGSKGANTFVAECESNAETIERWNDRALSLTGSSIGVALAAVLAGGELPVAVLFVGKLVGLAASGATLTVTGLESKAFLPAADSFRVQISPAGVPRGGTVGVSATVYSYSPSHPASAVSAAGGLLSVFGEFKVAIGEVIKAFTREAVVIPGLDYLINWSREQLDTPPPNAAWRAVPLDGVALKTDVATLWQQTGGSSFRILDSAAGGMHYVLPSAPSSRKECQLTSTLLSARPADGVNGLTVQTSASLRIGALPASVKVRAGDSVSVPLTIENRGSATSGPLLLQVGQYDASGTYTAWSDAHFSARLAEPVLNGISAGASITTRITVSASPAATGASTQVPLAVLEIGGDTLAAKLTVSAESPALAYAGLPGTLPVLRGDSAILDFSLQNTGKAAAGAARLGLGTWEGGTLVPWSPPPGVTATISYAPTTSLASQAALPAKLTIRVARSTSATAVDIPISASADPAQPITSHLTLLLDSDTTSYFRAQVTGAENYYLRATDYWITYADMEFADKNEHYLWIGHWMGFYEFPTVKQVEAAYGSPLGGYITKNATYTVTEISDDNYQTATLTFDAVGANSPGQTIHVEAKWRAKWVGDYHLVPLHRGQTPQP